MDLKIFHTGDIHLGMKFQTYPEGVRDSLLEARFSSLENMVTIASEKEAHLFVVAGDMFNTTQVAKKYVARAAQILNKFSGACVLVLPGNHDYDNGMTDLWDTFIRGINDRVVLLNESRVYDLNQYDLDVLVYPAPCQDKHSTTNNLGWIKDQGRWKEAGYHIGIAHGALEGLSADLEGNYYPMSMNELNSIKMDLWLLGHTHVIYPSDDKIKNNKIFNAGTPEPDGLDFRYEGSAWLISLNQEGSNAEKITSGHYRFVDKEFIIESDEDLDKVKTWALSNNPSRTVLRINLRGSLSKETYGSLSDFYGELEAGLFYLIVEDGDLKVKVDQGIIDKEFTKGSFPHEFLNGLLHDEEALQIAYDLIRR